METYPDPYLSFPMDPLFDSSDVNSRYLGLTSKGLFPATSYKSHDLPPWAYQSPLRRKGHLVPIEIFSEIFLYTVQDDLHSQPNLMLVCRHWRDIMLSTPGIHSQLRIYSGTEQKDIERFGRRWILDVTVDIQDITVDRQYKRDYNPVGFHACFMTAGKAASRWRSLVLVSFPHPGEYKDLQIMHPLQHLESFKLDASCELGNFLEPLITAITTTVTPRFTSMEVLHQDAARYIVRPAHFRAFSSLTTLRLACRRMQNPVDILPSLHKLEIFDAHHLSLPIHPPAVDLPLTQTLRTLRLKCVSIQWMAGQNFPALEECSTVFPQYADIFQSVYMPSCSTLKYDSNNLGALEHFYCPRLGKLEIKCGQCRKWRGDMQLAALHPIFTAQSVTHLQLEIKCSERLLSYMLRLVPALEDLWMGFSSPHALSSAFFLAFAAGGRNASVGPSSRSVAPLCRQLRKLHLHYKRWSRGAERNGLIPAFGAIVASHPPKEQAFSFQLSFGEGSELQDWIVHEPVERFDLKWTAGRTFIGVSSPHGIVPLSTALVRSPLTGLQFPPLPRESGYITTHERLELPIDYFFSLHSLKEVRMDILSLEFGPNIQSSPNAPLFHMLKVLAIGSASSRFMAGITFHKLERFKEEDCDCSYNPGQNPLTEMPICTRLVAPLSRLATLKLPQIRELGVFIDRKNPNYIWENHIAANTNLSGLRLLHLCVASHYGLLPIIEIIKTLGLLPTLETLVLDSQYLVGPYVNFFEAFVPRDVPMVPGLNQPSRESQVSQVLCPRLEGLQITRFWLAGQPELMPVLKDIVTLRANIGSPLKSFTLCGDLPPKKWELIGRDGSFMTEEVVPALEFQLVI